jgi:hypothetical protein
MLISIEMSFVTNDILFSSSIEFLWASQELKVEMVHVMSMCNGKMREKARHT